MRVITVYRDLGDGKYLIKDKATGQPYILQFKYVGFGVCEKYLLEISEKEFLTIWLA